MKFDFLLLLVGVVGRVLEVVFLVHLLFHFLSEILQVGKTFVSVK